MVEGSFAHTHTQFIDVYRCLFVRLFSQSDLFRMDYVSKDEVDDDGSFACCPLLVRFVSLLSKVT